MKKFVFHTLLIIFSFISLTKANSGEGGGGNVAHPGNPLCINGEEASSMTMLLLVSIIILCLLTLYLFVKFKLEHYIPESITTIVLGIIIGFIIRYIVPSEVGSRIAQLDPEFFFEILLPAIIFDAGYTLNKFDFFGNIGSITTYAFVGTAISTVTVGGGLFLFGYLGWSMGISLIDALIYGSLISAVDPVATLAIFSALKVNPTLHYLVFGESIVNDAVSIVLFQTFKELKEGGDRSITSMILAGTLRFFLDVFGSIALGIVFSLLAAIFFKYVDVKKHTHLELSFFLLFAYAPYLFALPYLSGIMCVLTSGIVMNHYVAPNLSKDANDTIKFIIRAVAFLFETYVFLFLGMAIFAFDHEWDFRLIVVTIGTCVLGRFFNIYPLSAILNSNRKKKISFRTQFIMFWSGLRGAIAFALVLGMKNIPVIGEKLFTTTIIVVLFTIVVFGGGTLPILKLLKIETQRDLEKQEMMKSDAEIARSKSESKNSLVRFDENYLQKIFLREEVQTKVVHPKKANNKIKKSISTYEVSSKPSKTYDLEMGNLKNKPEKRGSGEFRIDLNE